MSASKPNLDQIDVARLIGADASVWREFVRSVAPLLRAIVRRVLAPAGREADIADVLQDIFARLCREEFRLMRTYDPKKGRLSSWLGVLAARAAIDHLRQVGAAPPSLDALPPIATMSPGASEPGRAEKLSLPPDLVSPQQELILRLCYEDDLDVAEIARVLRTQPQTVRAQRHKALERLRAFLAKRNFF